MPSRAPSKTGRRRSATRRIAPRPRAGPSRAALEWGELARVLEANRAQTAAPCAVLDRCGACTLQTVPYSDQLAAKAQALRLTISQLGEPVDGFGPVAGLKCPFGYRTKLLMVAGGRPGALRFGFYRRGSTELVPAEGCPVQHPQTLATLSMVTQTLDAHRIAPTAVGRSGGWLHGLGVRVDPERAIAEVMLIGRTANVPDSSQLIAQLERLPGVHGLHLNVNPSRSSYPLGERFLRLGGAARTPFSLAGQQFLLSPGTFFQTCNEAAELLVDQVLGALPSQIGCLADLYGGAGIFSWVSYPRWRQAVVAEASPAALEDLRDALKRTRRRMTVLAGPVERSIAQIVERHPDVVLLDPPRRGCHPRVIEAISRARPRTIIYVACGMEALQRDAGHLIKGGYRLQRVSAVDMFPHTEYLEVVTRFAQASP